MDQLPVKLYCIEKNLFLVQEYSGLISLRACLKIKLDPTIGIGLMHLNRKMVALNC